MQRNAITKVTVTTLVTILLLLTLVTPVYATSSGLTVVSREGDGTWEGNDWLVSLMPGDARQTTITLRNDNDSEITARLYASPCLVAGCSVSICFSPSTLVIPAKSTRTSRLEINAKESAPPGVYNVTTTIEPKPDAAGTTPPPPSDPDPEPDPAPTDPPSDPPPADSDPDPPTPAVPDSTVPTNPIRWIILGAIVVLLIYAAISVVRKRKTAPKKDNDDYTSSWIG